MLAVDPELRELVKQKNKKGARLRMLESTSRPWADPLRLSGRDGNERDTCIVGEVAQLADIILYHGNDGAEEFYLTEEGAPRVLLFRQDEQPTWYVLECELDVLAREVSREAMPLSAIVSDLSNVLDARVVIDPAREWNGDDPRSHDRMKLRDAR